MQETASPEASHKEKQSVERKPVHRLFPLFLGDLVLIVTILLFTALFYSSLEKEIYMERTAYLEEISGQIVSAMDTISSAQWDLASIFANHLLAECPQEQENLAAFIGQEQIAFAQLGLVLLAFDDNGRYYDSQGNRARWNGSFALIDESSPEQQVEITTLSTTVNPSDEMVFILKMDRPVYLEKDDIRLTHVALVRNMNIFSKTFSVSSFKGEGDNYIITGVGTRVYRGQVVNTIIGDIYNVLKALEEVPFKYGRTYEELRQSVASGESCSLEFTASDGQTYYVTSSPMGTNDWSLLNIVPADVISVNMQRFMNMTLLGIGVIALIVITAVTTTIFLVVRYRSGQRLVRQQMRTNEALKEAASAAEEANHAKSVFLSHMSHDIRTPINGIMGMTDIALRNLKDETRVEDCLNKISFSSHHLLSLINDVLDMTRIESGKVEIENAPFHVDELLEGCYNVIAGQAYEKNLRLRKDFTGITMPYLRGDELHLRQILINILGNAIKFTPDAGEVTFLAKDAPTAGGESELTIMIRDNGIGMSKEFQQKIFQPFAQAEDSVRSNYQGTGLGMSIVKQLADLMGGHIELQSVLRKGSTFTVRLCLPIETHTAQASNAVSSKTDLSGMRVLLAEDNELNMEIACYILEECGVQVTPAANGSEALELFTQRPEGSFDIILMDVMMPVMDGLSAARAIRGSGRSDAEGIPIIAMTANAYAEDRKLTMEAGMNRHLAKPIKREELLQVLYELSPARDNRVNE